MNRIQKAVFALVVSIALVFGSGSFFSVQAVQRVNGYYKKSGTYVQPYYRSSKNSNFYDNYSTKGNINPYTGKKGTKTYSYGY